MISPNYSIKIITAHCHPLSCLLSLKSQYLVVMLTRNCLLQLKLQHCFYRLACGHQSPVKITETRHPSSSVLLFALKIILLIVFSLLNLRRINHGFASKISQISSLNIFWLLCEFKVKLYGCLANIWADIFRYIWPLLLLSLFWRAWGC